MIHRPPRFRIATMLLLGFVCSSVAGTAWAHVQATATPSQNKVQMFWKFPCSGPPPVNGSLDTSTTGHPPADLFVNIVRKDPDDTTNYVHLGGGCFSSGQPDEFVYVETHGCAEAGGNRYRLQSIVMPSASVGFAADGSQDPLHVRFGRTVTLGHIADVVQLTVTGGGLNAQSFGENQMAEATLKVIVYPNQAAADADAGSLIGAGSVFFGDVTLTGVGALTAQGFSLTDFVLQSLGGGLFTVRPVLGLTKIVPVPDANAAVITTIGDPKVGPSSPNTTLGIPNATARSGLWLGPASPNPARGETRFRYALPHEANVSLAIFDQQGRRVRQLVEGSMPAGEHEVSWDGRDASGRGVPTALYFYRLVADGQRLSGKVFALR